MKNLLAPACALALVSGLAVRADAQTPSLDPVTQKLLSTRKDR
jgi:hypothetical protein